MENTDLVKHVIEKANRWLNERYDHETRDRISYLLENDIKELTECFYRDLEFGTGGLRGLMGVGTNRMNKYTVGTATQGLSNYLIKEFNKLSQIKVAVAHDSRNNSRFFAETVAGIFSANGFKVFLFDDLRPTPELSFAIRHLGCQGGVMITASHNPKEYNGYKAYWDDGGQVTIPHDKLIIEEVKKISNIQDVKFESVPDKIEIIGSEFDDIYINKVAGLSLNPEVISKQKMTGIVYTPIHGTGVKIIPQALKRYGFENIINVPEQDITDGNFPTVKSPNPEESNALSMAIAKAAESEADLVMGTDPDGDRVGIAVRDNNNNFVLLSGNQAATLLIHYLLSGWTRKKKFKGNEYIAKTIVTTDLLSEIASRFKVPCYNVLTGFKYIAGLIRQFEGKKKFIGGGEESYGYLAGDFVRDKDAVIACCLIAEAAAFAKEEGKTLLDQLLEIYMEYGIYYEKLVSFEKQGKKGLEEIQAMMRNFRQNPPASVDGSKVNEVIDYLNDNHLKIANIKNNGIGFPKSDVLQLFTDDGSKISIRPSGTEPKIKFYFAVKTSLDSVDEYFQKITLLEQKVKRIINDILV